MLELCATVEEAINLIEIYNIESLKWLHVMIVDRSGASAVIEWGKDSLAVIYKKDDYQVLTNFTLTDPQLAGWYPCWRYTKAVNMLKEGDVSVDYFSAILKGVHQQGQYPTQYSNIYDLQNQVIYVYHQHNYNEMIKFDLNEELSTGFHSIELSSLFTHVEDKSPSESSLPYQFQLLNNFPNPFNPFTTIQFKLPQSGRVTIKIMNVLGQVVRTLIENDYGIGNYSTMWDGSDDSGNLVPSGIYFYSMESKDFKQVKKALLMR